MSFIMVICSIFTPDSGAQRVVFPHVKTLSRPPKRWLNPTKNSYFDEFDSKEYLFSW